MQIIRRVAVANIRSAAMIAVLSIAPLVCASSAQAWTFKTLYEFTAAADGYAPVGGLLRDPATGNLYGVTAYGGNGGCDRGNACGVIYKLSAKGKLTVLHTFNKPEEGLHPHGGLVEDELGNLYGTASMGGDPNCNFNRGCGVVFRLASDRTYTVLHTFNDADGSVPLSRLARDGATGDLYGTTNAGGQGEGVVFKLAADGTHNLLHIFRGPFQGGDGYYPWGGPTLDRHGNLYGTTVQGGDSNCEPNIGCGMVYKLAPDGTETVLHTFPRKGKGGPAGPLVRDGAGHFLGTATGNGHGVVFRIAPKGSFKVLHAFNDDSAGGPTGDLVVDASGVVFGAAIGLGFVSPGTIFQLDPDGTETVLYDFGYEVDPTDGVIADKGGNLYGTTSNGGGSRNGTIFELVKD